MQGSGRYLSFMSPALAAALVAALAGGCDRRQRSVNIVSLRVAQSALAEPLSEAGLEPAALETAARGALSAAGFAMGDGPRPRRARVEVVSVRLAPGGGAAPRVEVMVEIELSPVEDGKAGGAVRETGTGSAPLGAAAPAAAWRAALGSASREAAEALALGLAEEAKPIEAVIRDLAASDARVRQRAVRVLAERRSREAVPALLERLGDPDPEVVHRTVGALAQIRDPRAVGGLIDVSRRGDGAFTARLARLIGDIGGAEARGYLLTLESGHGDPRVRYAAHEALDEMARAAASAPVAAGK